VRALAPALTGLACPRALKSRLGFKNLTSYFFRAPPVMSHNPV
jgi:hypothetical protein